MQRSKFTRFVTTALLFASATGLAACADEDGEEGLYDGDQDPGASPELRRGCGTIEPSELEMAQIDAEVAAHMAALKSQPVSSVTGGTINVYWHVIRSGTSASQGNISSGQINQQIGRASCRERV